MLSIVTTPQDLDERFRAAVGALTAADDKREPDDPVRDGTALTGAHARRLFDVQLASRHLDLAARWLRSFDEGYYTIGSAGHEGNAAVAAALRPTDPALLHYRSGAFYCARAGQVAGGSPGAGSASAPAVADTSPGAGSASADTSATGEIEPIRDVLRGLVASAREPIAGGRHKVFGRAELNIVPTTSTVASHLPRAVGMAF